MELTSNALVRKLDEMRERVKSLEILDGTLNVKLSDPDLDGPALRRAVRWAKNELDTICPPSNR